MKLLSEILAALLAFMSIIGIITTVTLIFLGIVNQDHMKFLLFALYAAGAAIIIMAVIFLLVGRDKKRFWGAMVDGTIISHLPPW